MFGLNVGFSDELSNTTSSQNQQGTQAGYTTFNPYANQALGSLGQAYGQSGSAYLSALQGLSGMATQDTGNQANLLNALQSAANIGQPQFQENLAAVRGRGYGGGQALDLKQQNQMLQDYQNQRQAALDQMVLQNQQQQDQNKLAAGQALGGLSGLGNQFLQILANQTQQYQQSGSGTAQADKSTMGAGGGVGF